jgi:cold-inducible RNA-binding protein
MATRLFVGNLSFNTTEGDVLDLFKQAGTVTSCALIMDKMTNKSRGFGFVEMSTTEEAAKAIRELNARDLDGRPVTVSEAKPREERSRSDFAGSRR